MVTASPVVTIDVHPPAAGANTAADFVFAVDASVTTTCSVDGGAFVPCDGSLSLRSLAVGEHKLVVRATDTSGNSAEKTFSWEVTRPTVVFTAKPSGESDDTATFVWRSDSANVQFTCSLDGAAPTTCSSPYTVANLNDGPHSFVVSAGPAESVIASWTSRKNVPLPSILISAKITPTDLLGRPKLFKQSTDVPRSSGPFTRKLDVTLHVPTPDGVTRILISNYPDFRDEHEFAPASDEQYDWRLLAGPSGERPVYIRYDDAPGAPFGQASIVLDQELPGLKPVPWKSLRATQSTARRTGARRTIVCGGAPRRWLKLPGADRFSGLNALQIARDPKHPCAWRPYLPTISYRLRGTTLYLRIEDRVGNISRWYRIHVPNRRAARHR